MSDTHNPLRPEALALLAGCDHIAHGGDISVSESLARLAAAAPLSVAVHAVHDMADLHL